MEVCVRQQLATVAYGGLVLASSLLAAGIMPMVAPAFFASMTRHQQFNHSIAGTKSLMDRIPGCMPREALISAARSVETITSAQLSPLNRSS